ncbi:iron-sulfur cluster co-chaperone protein HscB-like protein, mitochondrial isoform X1 [Tachypleus tridentatus]|uniref:iron-sulfur cluster co-chaperone protein HscB-like protein, mitochondrial isoform X1 n=1 Tax=Tachypleus tridentatus TaxID=6853 RepID=UPI003FD47C21
MLLINIKPKFCNLQVLINWTKLSCKPNMILKSNVNSSVVWPALFCLTNVLNECSRKAKTIGLDFYKVKRNKSCDKIKSKLKDKVFLTLAVANTFYRKTKLGTFFGFHGTFNFEQDLEKIYFTDTVYKHFVISNKSINFWNLKNGKIVTPVHKNVCLTKHTKGSQRMFSTSRILSARNLTKTSHNLIKCWSCGVDLQRNEPVCTSCDTIQKPEDSSNYFAVFGFHPTFDIDSSELSMRFKKLQQKLHPDKSVKKTKKEKLYSQGQSAIVNRAYQTLQRPLNRGLYLLRLVGCPLEEEEINMEQEFLTQIMEFNEQISEITDLSELEAVANQISHILQEMVTSVQLAFRENRLEDAKIMLTKMIYFTNIEDKIKDTVIALGKHDI